MKAFPKTRICYRCYCCCCYCIICHDFALQFYLMTVVRLKLFALYLEQRMSTCLMLFFLQCLQISLYTVFFTKYFTSVAVFILPQFLLPSSQIPMISVGIRFSAKRLSEVVQLDSTKLDIVWVYNRLTNYPALSRVVNSFFILLSLLLLTNSFKNSRL